MAEDNVLTFKRPAELDRTTVEKRTDRIASLVYQAKSIASAAEAALCNQDGGTGSDVHGCLQSIQRLMNEACDALDCVVLFAPAEAQEVANA